MGGGEEYYYTCDGHDREDEYAGLVAEFSRAFLKARQRLPRFCCLGRV